MQFTFHQIGSIDAGDVEIGDLTIICGPNGSGKTYISYALYGFFKFVAERFELKINSKHLRELEDVGLCKIDLSEYEGRANAILAEISKEYSDRLHKVFSSSEEHFNGSSIRCEVVKVNPNYGYRYEKTLRSKKQEIIRISKEYDSRILEVSSLSEDKSEFPSKFLVNKSISDTILDVLFEGYFFRPFAITSERTGISLFYKELDINKNVMMEFIASSRDMDADIDPIEVISEVYSRYAMPIKDNIDVVRDYDTISKMKSFLQKDSRASADIAKSVEKIISGNYRLIGKQVFYVPAKERNRDKVSPIPIYMTSSAIKSLVILDMYVRYLAQPNDILIIDEPELNLHPTNQILMAKLLAKLVNSGVKVLITTHSDYIVREFNNLIMLSADFPGKARVLKKYKYEDNELLSPDRVRIYTATRSHTIEKVEVNKDGFDLEMFDEVILDSNEKASEIYYSISN